MSQERKSVVAIVKERNPERAVEELFDRLGGVGTYVSRGDKILIKANAAIDAEIGEIVNGTAPGRQSDDEITFFKSVGVACQDAAAAAAVLAGAQEKNLGQMIDLG